MIIPGLMVPLQSTSRIAGPDAARCTGRSWLMLKQLTFDLLRDMGQGQRDHSMGQA